jgi:hypothetical protein
MSVVGCEEGLYDMLVGLSRYNTVGAFVHFMIMSLDFTIHTTRSLCSFNDYESRRGYFSNINATHKSQLLL